MHCFSLIGKSSLERFLLHDPDDPAIDKIKELLQSYTPGIRRWEMTKGDYDLLSRPNAAYPVWDIVDVDKAELAAMHELCKLVRCGKL